MLVKTYDVIFSTKNGEQIKPKLFQEVHRHVYLPAVKNTYRAILCVKYSAGSSQVFDFTYIKNMALLV